MPALPDLGFYDYMSVLSYSLIALSYMMRNMAWLRIITLGACVLDLVIYYFIRPGQPMWVQISMNLAFIVINSYQLLVLHREKVGARFEGDAKMLYQLAFARLKAVEFKRLHDIGSFRSVAAGQQLLTQGQPVREICVVLRGELDVRSGQQLLSRIQPGHFAGEMGYLTGMPASANVVAAIDSTLFALPAEALDKLLERDRDLHAALLGQLGADVAHKLSRMSSKHNEQAGSPTQPQPQAT